MARLSSGHQLGLADKCHLGMVGSRTSQWKCTFWTGFSGDLKFCQHSPQWCVSLCEHGCRHCAMARTLLNVQWCRGMLNLQRCGDVQRAHTLAQQSDATPQDWDDGPAVAAAMRAACCSTASARMLRNGVTPMPAPTSRTCTQQAMEKLKHRNQVAETSSRVDTMMRVPRALRNFTPLTPQAEFDTSDDRLQGIYAVQVAQGI